nr:MAG TPA: hypothetical protein [Caudoviricetes sp.]
MENNKLALFFCCNSVSTPFLPQYIVYNIYRHTIYCGYF